MNIAYPATKHATVTLIEASFTVDHDEELEDLRSQGFEPGGSGLVVLRMNPSTRRVENWARGGAVSFHIKVRDEGAYRLYVADPPGMERCIASFEGYVPKCIPNKYGDYIVMTILPDGTVDGWRPTAEEIVDSFFPSDY